MTCPCCRFIVNLYTGHNSLHVYPKYIIRTMIGKLRFNNRKAIKRERTNFHSGSPSFLKKKKTHKIEINKNLFDSLKLPWYSLKETHLRTSLWDKYSQQNLYLTLDSTTLWFNTPFPPKQLLYSNSRKSYEKMRVTSIFSSYHNVTEFFREKSNNFYHIYFVNPFPNDKF